MSVIKRFGLLLLALPIIGAIIAFAYTTLVMRGTFVKWEFLGKPSEGEAIKVIWADYVEIASGDVYHVEYNSNYPNGVNWIKSEKTSSFFDLESSPSTEQSCIGSYNMPSLNGFVDSKVVCAPWGEGVFLTITAIDDAGNVYSWKKGNGGSDSVNLLLSPFIGAIFGALTTVPFIVVQKNTTPKNTAQQSVQRTAGILRDLRALS